GDADELGVRSVGQPVDGIERDLGLVAAVGLDLLGLEPDSVAEGVDRLEHSLLGDLEAGILGARYDCVHLRTPSLSVNVSPLPPRPPRRGGPGRSARARTTRSTRAPPPWQSAPPSSCRRSERP